MRTDFTLGVVVSSEAHGNNSKILTINPTDPNEAIRKLNRIVQTKLNPNIQFVIQRRRRDHGREGRRNRREKRLGVF